MKRISVVLAALSVAGSVHAFSFSDGDFAVGDYVHFGYFNHVSTSGQRSATGGNPDATMIHSIQHDGSNNLGFGRVGSFHQVHTYNPSVSGAISSVNFSADYYLDTSNLLNGQNIWFAVLQGGKTYYNWDLHNFSPHQWLSANATMQANVAQTVLDWQDGGVTFEVPDFSASGAEMKFGFITAYNLENGAALSQRIDNFTVRTTPVPEPATLAVLGMGAAALASKRRKRTI